MGNHSSFLVCCCLYKRRLHQYRSYEAKRTSKDLYDPNDDLKTEESRGAGSAEIAPERADNEFQFLQSRLNKVKSTVPVKTKRLVAHSSRGRIVLADRIGTREEIIVKQVYLSDYENERKLQLHLALELKETRQPRHPNLVHCVDSFIKEATELQGHRWFILMEHYSGMMHMLWNIWSFICLPHCFPQFSQYYAIQIFFEKFHFNIERGMFGVHRSTCGRSRSSP